MDKHGVLLIDKPSTWTSHDVVARVRRLANTRKVGHAGTLDPLATGLLLLGLGFSTRLLTYMVGLDKEYVATLRLGQSTSTDDADGEITATASSDQLAAITENDIARCVHSLTGRIEQIPSTVSAIKIQGKRAYARVRAGEKVVLESRPVTVFEFTIMNCVRSPTFIDLCVRVVCSSGTYIRALARDLGEALGVGGHVTVLRRTRVGPFRVEESHSLDAFSPVSPARESQLISPNQPTVNQPTSVNSVNDSLMPPQDAATRLFPHLLLTTREAQDLSQGKQLVRPEPFKPEYGALDSAELEIPTSEAPNPAIPTSAFIGGVSTDSTGPVAAIDPLGNLIGLVSVKKDIVKTLVNFPLPTNTST